MDADIRNGIILSVANYPDCLRFYREKIGLEVLMEKPGITRLRFGTLYLQIEDSEVVKMGPTRNVILRENVKSVSRKQQELAKKGVDLEIHDLEWGKIGLVYDPNGNKLEYFREK